MEEKRIEDITFKLRMLKEAHDWTVINFNNEVEPSKEDKKFYDNILVPAVDIIVEDLEKLGVSKTLGYGLFIFGGDVLKVRDQLKSGV